MVETIYLLILVAAFIGIVIWVYGRKRTARFEADARIPLDNDKSSRVPVSLLNPEGKILIFYGSFGPTANFAMVPKFEESAKKSTRELVKWVVLASSAQNSG